MIPAQERAAADSSEQLKKRLKCASEHSGDSSQMRHDLAHHLALDLPAGTGALGRDCPAAGATGKGADVVVAAGSGLIPGPDCPEAVGIRADSYRPAADLTGTGADFPDAPEDGVRPALFASGDAVDAPTRLTTANGATVIGGAPCAQSGAEHPSDVAATPRSFIKV